MEQRPHSRIEKLTFAGRLLVIGTLLLFGAVFYFYYIYLAEHLPAGHYPLVLFWLPAFIAAPIFFFIVAAMLERLGIRIYKR